MLMNWLIALLCFTSVLVNNNYTDRRDCLDWISLVSTIIELYSYVTGSFHRINLFPLYTPGYTKLKCGNEQESYNINLSLKIYIYILHTILNYRRKISQTLFTSNYELIFSNFSLTINAEQMLQASSHVINVFCISDPCLAKF